MYFGHGVLLGASLVAVVAGTAGALMQSLVPAVGRWIVLGAAAAVVIAREFGLVSLRIPENRRLVPERVTYLGPDVGALQFGFEMGTGMRSYSPSALPHLLLIGIVTVVPFGGALAAAAGFAAGRWVMAPASIAYDDDGSWSEMWSTHQRLLAMLTTVAMLLAMAAGLAV